MKINTYDITVKYYEDKKHSSRSPRISTHMGLSLSALEYYKRYYTEAHEALEWYITTNVTTKSRTNSTTNATTIHETLSSTNMVTN